MIGINGLYEGMGAPDLPVASVLFAAWNEGRRFRIDVEWRPELDPAERFVLTVFYQPWPRNERGRRRKDIPFAFDMNEEVVGTLKTDSYSELLLQLEDWLDRCSVWCREGN
ncbi:MAG: hypothetical protein KKE69_11090 [Alphaproteobacteria bacterium]|nr:hypothetical protein [Alphaproteobacteria bacterium]